MLVGEFLDKLKVNLEAHRRFSESLYELYDMRIEYLNFIDGVLDDLKKIDDKNVGWSYIEGRL